MLAPLPFRPETIPNLLSFGRRAFGVVPLTYFYPPEVYNVSAALDGERVYDDHPVYHYAWHEAFLECFVVCMRN